MTLWCVIPAAGKGLRVGGSTPKQYLPLAGKTVMQCTIDRLSALPVQTIVVAISADDTQAATLAWQHPQRLRFVTGGKERADSVLAGLQALRAEAADDDWVLVHDVARPCVRLSDINNLLQHVAESSVGGLLASRVRDTMKRESAGYVAETISREHLWQALTPQVFRFGLLYRALQQASAKGMAITDEAQAIEALGHAPLLVEGNRDNLKITYAEDLPMAEAFLRLQAESIV